jgi:uncharacterized membrane protein
MLIGFLKKYKLQFLMGVFALIYGLIAFVNHYCFRTFALDLGVYTNALYDYAHGQWNDASLFKEQSRNLLSDHLDFTLIFLGPISHLLGHYTLQFAQICFVLFGGLGIYKFLLEKNINSTMAFIATVHFFLFFGIYAALSFDYHSNVLAAMLLPWFLLFLQRKDLVKASVFFFLMLLCKESIALWLASVCFALIIEYRKDKKSVLYLSLATLFSFAYFFLAIKFIMPALSPEKAYGHFKYHVLGTDYLDALKNVIFHPLDFLKHLFFNHTGNPRYDWVKIEFYSFIVFSGAIVLFLKPSYLLMLFLPIVSKMCYDDPAIWSIDCHYSIEFAPVISLGLFLVLGKLKSLNLQRNLAILACVFTFAVSIRLMDHTIYKHDYNRLRIYQKGHYSRGHNIQIIHQYLKQIPTNAAVSAQSPILPHLAYRDQAYQYPLVKNAEYIVVSRIEPETYPIDKQCLIRGLNDSIASGRWTVVVDCLEISILKKK